MRVDKSPAFGRSPSKKLWKFMLEDDKVKRKPARKNASVKTERKGDLITMSAQAEKQLRDEYIEKTLKSGDPLKGISYGEFKEFFKENYFDMDDESMRRQYRQALKGDNASVREKEWRTNPNYRIPYRLADHPLIAEDREAVLEKYKSGEELTDCEKNIMQSLNYIEDGDKIRQNADRERMISFKTKDIVKTLSDAGIFLSENDEVKFEVRDGKMKVSGNIDEEKQLAVQNALKDKADTIYSIYKSRRDVTSINGFDRLEHSCLSTAVYYLKGTGVTVFDISLNDKGEVTGLPVSEDEFIKQCTGGKEYMEQTTRDLLRSAIRTVKNGKYELYMPTARLTFRNGEFFND